MKPRRALLAGAAVAAIGCGSNEPSPWTRCSHATFVWPFRVSHEYPALDHLAYAVVDVPIGGDTRIEDEVRNIAGKENECPAYLTLMADMSIPSGDEPRILDWDHPCGQLLYKDGQVMDFDRARPDQIPQLELFRRVDGDTEVALCMDRDRGAGAWVGGIARSGSDTIACHATPAYDDPVPSLRLCGALRIVADVPEYRLPMPEFSKDPDGIDTHATGSASGR
jgi:hypothetical protein